MTLLQSAPQRYATPRSKPRSRGGAPDAMIGSAQDELNLLRLLQTSLEPAELLLVFSAAIAESVPHHGLDLYHRTGSISIGDTSGHSSDWPVWAGRSGVATLRLHDCRDFHVSHLPLMSQAVALLAHPLSNALVCDELKRKVREDSLTGLLNRAALDTILPRELSLAQREGRPLCLLMLDLDNFKEINDRFGHGTGDQVLRTVSSVLKACLRLSDLAFRYGGEEFVILLPDTDTEGGHLTAERIRSAIAAQAARTLPCAVTGSIGLASGRCHQLRTDTLLERADRALYRAKAAGRNRVLAA